MQKAEKSIKIEGLCSKAQEIIFLEGFESRRNSVFRVMLPGGREAVLKLYDGEAGEQKCIMEYENLIQLKSMGINVPEVLSRTGNSLLLEHISGPLANILAENLDMGIWVEKLAEWLCRYHSIEKDGISLLKGDVNLRNFILHDGLIYGIDFEELQYGDPLQDMADVCFFILTNRPAYKKDKDILVRRFLHEYKRLSGIETGGMPQRLLESRKRARLRRQQNRTACRLPEY